MASPFLPLAAWITSGRPLPFPRGSEQSRSTANGCGNTSPTRLLTGDAPERTMIADWFQSICSMVNTVNKRPDSHALRTTALRANLCMGSESANRGATPADDEDVPSFVSEGRARRISPQVPTVALEGAGKHWIDPGSGTGARALQLPALPRRWLRRQSTTTRRHFEEDQRCATSRSVGSNWRWSKTGIAG